MDNRMGDTGKGVYYNFSSERRLKNVEQSFEEKLGRTSVIVEAGQAGFIDNPLEMLVGTVGEGIIVTMYDEKLNLGGMAYCVLPPDLVDAFPMFKGVDEGLLERVSAPVQDIINEMKKSGAGKKRIKVRLFGGANIDGKSDDVGIKNYIFAKGSIGKHGLQIVGEDIGGKKIRRIHFMPDVGNVSRHVLGRECDVNNLKNQENLFFSSL